jgi:hypothetical protein
VYVRVEDNGEGILPDRLRVILKQASPRTSIGDRCGFVDQPSLARLMDRELPAHTEVAKGSVFALPSAML